MKSVEVDTLVFEFDDEWAVSKFDEWKFYRNRFSSIPCSLKAVDLLAISPDGDLILLESKNYRNHPRTKPSKIHEEVARKVVDTLAALLPAACDGDFPDEQSFAAAALDCRKIRVVLHIEQAKAGSRVSPRKFKLEDIQLKLRQALKAVDPRCRTTEGARMGSVAWTCR